jgi:hypothetical protein
MMASAFLQSISVHGTTATVEAHATPMKGKCPLEIVEYYWWNCFRAHNDASKFGVIPKNVRDEAWKGYGWELGDKIDTQAAQGSSTLFEPQYDSSQWGWTARIVYMYCDTKKGIISLDWVCAPEKEYSWSVLRQSWTDFSPSY